MAISNTRAHANSTLLRRCWLGVMVVSFTGGCVRELTELTLAALPTADASVFDAATENGNADGGDARVPETNSSDAGRVNSIDAVLDAGARGDAGESGGDAGTQSVAVRELDAGASSSFSPTIAPGPEAGTRVLDGGLDAGSFSEDWVFAVAQLCQPGDAGLAVVPMFPAVGNEVDGSSREWSDEGWLWIATADASIGEPPSARDLSAALAVRWDATKLYLAVAVMDERHVNEASGFDIWGGDSVQVAFDVGQGRTPYDWEYGFARTTNGLVAHRWREGDADLTEDMEFAVVRHGAVTVYEVAFEARHLGVDSFPTDVLRFSAAVNDNDGIERTAALELVQGIVGTKSDEQFATADWKR